MTFNDKFKDLILDIEHNGNVSQPRDMNVKELTVQTLKFDPTQTIAHFDSRSFNWKSCFTYVVAKDNGEASVRCY